MKTLLKLIPFIGVLFCLRCLQTEKPTTYNQMTYKIKERQGTSIKIVDNYYFCNKYLFYSRINQRYKFSSLLSKCLDEKKVKFCVKLQQKIQIINLSILNIKVEDINNFTNNSIASVNKRVYPKIFLYIAKLIVSMINLIFTITFFLAFATFTRRQRIYMQLGVIFLLIAQSHCCASGCDPATCNSSICMSCLNGYFYISPTTDGNGDSNNDGSCSNCSVSISNCSLCSASNTCTNCESGYFVSLSGACSLCSSALSNCVTCANGNYCNTCNSIAYYLNASSGYSNCAPCSLMQCATCTNKTYCITCTSSLYYINRTMLGYSNCGLCQSVLANCVTCSNRTYCNTCISPLYYVKAVNTISSCCLCSMGLINCSSCNNVTYLGSSVINCLVCVNTNALVINSTHPIGSCSPCYNFLLGCYQCSSRYSCSICLNDSFVYLGSSHSCIPCSTYLNGCYQCGNSSFCKVCYPGFYMVANRCYSCGAAMPGCALCNVSTTCVACVSSAYYQYLGLCYLCTNRFKFCATCTVTGTVCLSCQDTFYLSSIKNCTCLKGNLVGILCLDIFGCTESQLYNSRRLCTACADQFVFDLQTLKCKCIFGNYVSNVCTNLTGCISVFSDIDGTQRCLMCNMTSYFHRNGSQCVCNYGFELFQNSICQEICGDGILFVLPCDDGNIRNGDGCSSTCQIEMFFQCHGGNETNSTKCFYQGKPIGLQLTKIYKKTESNTGVFIFTVKNIVPFIQNINFSQFIKFYTQPQHSIKSVAYSKGKLIVTVDYTQNLEGLPATLSLNFQKFFFVTDFPLNISFAMISQTSPLVIIDYPSTKILELFNYLLLIATIIGIAIFLIGSSFHKMIGLQTLNVFQLAYFLPLVLTDSSIVLQCFHKLSLSTGYGKELFYSMEQAQIFGLPFVKSETGKQFIQNMVFNGPYLIGAILLLVLMSVLHCIREYKKIKKNLGFINGLSFYAYHRLVFPLAMGMISIIVFSIILNNLQVVEWQSQLVTALTTPNYNFLSGKINTILILLLSIIVIFIGTMQVIVSLKISHDPSNYQKAFHSGLICMLILNNDKIGAEFYYVGIYLVNFLITLFITMAYVCQQIFYSIFLISSLIIAYTIFILATRPYNGRIHNAGIFLILGTEIIICAGLSIKQYFLWIHQPLQPYYELMWAGTVIGLLMGVDMMAVVRILIKMNCQNEKDNQSNENQCLSQKMKSNHLGDSNLLMHFSVSKQKKRDIVQEQEKQNVRKINLKLQLNFQQQSKSFRSRKEKNQRLIE